jgi:hypothetical protein
MPASPIPEHTRALSRALDRQLMKMFSFIVVFVGQQVAFFLWSKFNLSPSIWNVFL